MADQRARVTELARWSALEDQENRRSLTGGLTPRRSPGKMGNGCRLGESRVLRVCAEGGAFPAAVAPATGTHRVDRPCLWVTISTGRTPAEKTR